MSTPSPPEAPRGSAEAVLRLWEDLQDPALRYLNVQDERFRSVPDKEMDGFLDEVLLVKGYLEALRLPSGLPRMLLEKCRGMDWYQDDREALSRHAALLALLPDATDRERVPGAAGEFTLRLLGERKELSRNYLHMYTPAALGAPAGTGHEDRGDLYDEILVLDMELTGLSQGEWEEYEYVKERMAVASAAVHDVDPLYLEESLAVWDEVRRAGDAIASENEGTVSGDISDAMMAGSPSLQSLLTRFVLESLMLRLMREDGAGSIEKVMDRWLGQDRPGPDTLRPVAREEADRSLDLLEQLLYEPYEARVRMMEAAMNTAYFEDLDSSWNMVQAVLARCEEEDYWPEMALKGVTVQMYAGDGRQVELSKALLARGEEHGSAGTAAAGLVAMTMSLHALGRSGEAAEYRRRMLRDLLAGRDDPEVLAVYPLAATVALDMGDRKGVRELAGEGYRAMGPFPELQGERERLRELRKTADRLDKEREAGSAKHRRGYGKRKRPC